MTDHTHAWIRVAHIDNCHDYGDVLTCECGASREIGHERDVSDDWYSAIWMDNSDRDEPCARCDELMGGAKPKQWDTITPPTQQAAKP